jgi:hypothetical protein
MPVVEKRKPFKIGEVSTAVILPKQWTDFFKIDPDKSDELELIVDTPVVIFPPKLNKKQKVEALEKIAKMVELTPGV